MFLVECQAEKRNIDIDIPLTFEFKPRTLNERFLWNALKQVKKKNKILLEKKNSMTMGREKDIKESDKVTNTQLLSIEKYKLQTDILEDQPNKGPIDRLKNP